ncbi:hypothetical protein [Kitasatospora sp. NPDC085879]|uniref:hypothetical protein n=1 Tax=Kitasatospora sp. NPDC085879 TaxID=3154769 RepID=UPI003448A661
MSTTPEGLVAKILTGIEYPSAREDDLLVQAHTFHGLAADLRALHERQQALNTYIPGWHGPGYDAHRQALDRILGEHGGLLALAERSDAIGDGITSTAGSTAKAKYQFQLTITWVLASAAWAIYCAAFTAGASLTWLTAIEAAARTALGQIGQWLVRAIAAAGMGALIVAGTDAAAQGLAIATGYADHFDVSSFLMSVAAGAMGGAVGLGIGTLAGAAEIAARGTTNLTTGLLGQTLVQGAGGYATQLVMSAAEGHLNTDWGGFVAGATGALAGHLVARHSLATDHPTATVHEPLTDPGKTATPPGDTPPAYGDAAHGGSGRTSDDKPPSYQETIATAAPRHWSTVPEKQLPLDTKTTGTTKWMTGHSDIPTNDLPTPLESTRSADLSVEQRTISAGQQPTHETAMAHTPEQTAAYAPARSWGADGPAVGHPASLATPELSVPAEHTVSTAVGGLGATAHPETTHSAAAHPGQAGAVIADTAPGHTATAGPMPASHAPTVPEVQAADSPAANTPQSGGPGSSTPTVSTAPAMVGEQAAPHVMGLDTPVGDPADTSHAAMGPAGEQAAPHIMGLDTPVGDPADTSHAATDPAVATGPASRFPETADHGLNGEPEIRSGVQEDAYPVGGPPPVGQQTPAAPGHSGPGPVGGAAFHDPQWFTTVERPVSEGTQYTTVGDRVRREALQAFLLENPQAPGGVAGPTRAEGPGTVAVPAGPRPALQETGMRGLGRQEIRDALNPQGTVRGPARTGGGSVYDPAVIAEVLSREPLQVYSYSNGYGFAYRREAFAKTGATSCDSELAASGNGATSPTYSYATSPTAYSYQGSLSTQSLGSNGSYPASESTGR